MPGGRAIEFGYLPNRYDVKNGDLAIVPRVDFAQIVDTITKHPQTHNGWVYPPLVDGRPDPVQRFELPTTHQLVHRKSRSMKRLQFLVMATGFITGYRLLPKGHGHLQRVSIKSSLVTDILVTSNELGRALHVIDKTWEVLLPDQRKLLLASMTAYLWGVACSHQFERFTSLYAALDAVCKFHFSGRASPEPAHWERARELSKHLGIPVPWWARKHRHVPGAKKKKNKSSLSKLRNELAHEALFAGEPLGYAVERRQIELDLQGLISRGIVAALGLRCQYIRTPVTTRQIIGLDLL